MTCNSCAKPYTLFRKEKGCPDCGFSYCSSCLNHKIFLKKLNCEVKVCPKCVVKNSSDRNKKQSIDYPDVYFKRIGVSKSESNDPNSVTINDTTSEIEKRLQSLKEERSKVTDNETIENRLQNIKGTQPSTSDAELQLRLANLKDLPVIEIQNKPAAWIPDNRSEQEQADALLKCYIEQTYIDKQYNDGFTKQIDDIESRLLALRANTGSNDTSKVNQPLAVEESEDEEIEITKLIEKVKAESLLDDVSDITVANSVSHNDELPFCEICNEDAKMRCLGCCYLFCKRCYLDHKDDDDGCNRYEPYQPPKPS